MNKGMQARHGAFWRATVPVRVTGALPEGVLNALAGRGIPFRGIQKEDAYTLRLTLRPRDLATAAEAARRCGCEFEAGAVQGPPAALRLARRHAFLFAGAIGILLLLFISSLYIWDIEVTENNTCVSDTEILNALEDIGVGVGSFWPAFTSDMIRSHALVLLPDLSWLTVNVHGSRAEVLVRARTVPPELVDVKAAINVTAARAGIITEMHVLEGDPVVSVGDTVVAGETLVSGTRNGKVSGSRTVHAQAEILARTWYTITASSPLTVSEKTYTGGEKIRFVLIIGSRRINFYAGSGILDAECDKIIKIRPVALENVFTLPVAFASETVREYKTQIVQLDRDALCSELEARLLERLEAQMGENGTVVSTHFSSAMSDGMMTVTLRAECTERIDQEEPLIPE